MCLLDSERFGGVSQKRSGVDGSLAGFVAFDQYKALLADANGKISGPRTVMAGFGAGVTESLLAVTPFESIKTTLYAFQASACTHV